MELHAFGPPEAPAVLLLPARDMGWEALYAALRPLEKSCRLLCPARTASPAELETALLGAAPGCLWGAYGLREGADALLELLARNRLQIRTAVAEGAGSLPTGGLGESRTRLILWRSGRDRRAKRTWKALKKVRPELPSLTLKKLRRRQDLPSLRSDLAVKRLQKALGTAVGVESESTLPRGVEEAWRFLLRRGAADLPRGLSAEPPIRVEAERLQILELRGKGLPFARHSLRLEPRGEELTAVTDRVELAAGVCPPAARLLGRAYLFRERRRRRARLRRGE